MTAKFSSYSTRSLLAILTDIQVH